MTQLLLSLNRTNTGSVCHFSVCIINQLHIKMRFVSEKTYFRVLHGKQDIVFLFRFCTPGLDCDLPFAESFFAIRNTF